MQISAVLSHDLVSKKNKNYNEKFEVISQQTIYSLLKEENQNFIKQIAFKYRFTLSELRIICEISKDLQMWMKNPIEHYWNIIQIENKIYENDKSNQNIKQLKKQITPPIFLKKQITVDTILK